MPRLLCLLNPAWPLSQKKLQAGSVRRGESIARICKAYNGVVYGRIPGIEGFCQVPVDNSPPVMAWTHGLKRAYGHISYSDYSRMWYVWQFMVNIPYWDH